MPNLFLVMIGGALGAGLRYEAARVALRHLGPNFPWGTLFVNLVGGLLLGLLAGTLIGPDEGQELRLMLGVGVLGGFTTFSAFSLETYLMVERGQFATALGYAGGSVIGSVAMVAAGLWLARMGG